ncbi:hypothetical protein LFT44_08945 [Arthrobacter sp. FW306-05-C]|uniref:hypothetical protein n=1 Tax=Arthrobacter sp. FW306-05-C TaxID=2879620 RepID=UPI001F3CC1CC|nr:hypothetical protein [Arthrobacter sp. FW306-05-C]UKA68491.1 hypothetical protein LFT44_08945 [Arthrobacter sp. FW306-05-C]
MYGNQEIPFTVYEDLSGVLPIQLQAREIIDDILRSPVADEADIRASLRRHAADHPGQPEKALLIHMLTVRRSLQYLTPSSGY